MTIPTTAPPKPTVISDIEDICVFDLETTGINVDEDRIVTAYLGRINRTTGEITGEYEWLINPGVPIPEGAAAVHGITDEVAATGQPAAVGIAEIQRVIRRSIDRGLPIVAYNGAFDLSMLNAELRRHNLGAFPSFGCVIDPYVVDKAVDKYRRGSRKLIDTAGHYGVTLTGAHDAREDAVATGGVCWAVLDLLTEKFGDMTLKDLYRNQKAWAAEQAASLQEYFRRTKDPETVVDGGWPIRAGESRRASQLTETTAA
ncbi:exonuclease domain-containing protein [Leifsonia sp. Leaf264]|uniref:exonuclease domain-containing protein n=1 Tax=Leifsonia sp. Leaf264 TaxID=1736314 RepID=UPI0006F47927|nr:exonuclease domain-containing protein [Leifsonia sp. Leaf264]KQO98801.1 hypothetical protein ASF30_12120 [Leifsonia sp. Leaf264]